jgi:hypothetical protein
MGTVALARGKSLGNFPALELLDFLVQGLSAVVIAAATTVAGRCKRRARDRTERWRQVLGSDFGIVAGEHRGALHFVTQLPQVARPGMPEQTIQGCVREHARPAIGGQMRALVEEVGGEQTHLQRRRQVADLVEKQVPWSASKNSPLRSCKAPVNAPFR